MTTLLTGCQAAIYKDLNQIGSKTQRNELWVLQNWSRMIQHQPSTTTVKGESCAVYEDASWIISHKSIEDLSLNRPPLCCVQSILHHPASGIAAHTAGIQASGLRSTSSSNEKAPEFQRHKDTDTEVPCVPRTGMNWQQEITINLTCLNIKCIYYI